MSSDLDPYLHAYACECFGWKCFIGNEEAMDQIGIEEQFLADGYVVFTDSLDRSKWVFCTTCRKPFHLKCVTTQTEHQVKLKGWPFICTFNECQGKKKSSGSPLPPVRLDLPTGSPSGSIFLDFLFFTERWQSKNSQRKARGEGPADPRTEERRHVP